MWNLKTETNEYNKIETDLKIQRTNQLPVGGRKEGGGKIGVEDEKVQTTMYKINKIQGYVVQHRNTANSL